MILEIVLSIMYNPVLPKLIRLGNKNLYLLNYLAKSPSESTVLYFIVHSL